MISKRAAKRFGVVVLILLLVLATKSADLYTISQILISQACA